MKPAGVSRKNYLQVRFGYPDDSIHYEWIVRKLQKCMDVALHFESDDPATNTRWLKSIEAHQKEIGAGVGLPFLADPWGKKWAHARIQMPYQGDEPVNETALKAASLMKALIEQTLPVVQQLT